MLAHLFSLATYVPTIAVTARRLHDSNKSGWLQVWWSIAIVVGMVLVIYGFASTFMHTPSSSPAMLMGGLGGLLMLAGIAIAIKFLAQPGDTSDNQYGSPPAN